jgi:predicted transport protein
LEAYADYSQGLLTKEDFLSVIRLVENYVFRRAICGIPSNSMNKTFATIMRGVDKTHYRQSIEAAFMALSSYKRFPRDEEFRQALVVKDVYHFQRRNYFLRKLENHRRKERVKVEGFTIEHIMPQNPQLSAEWQQELGKQWEEIHNRYLHTIGNLTLTAYNSEMGDRSFEEKRTIPGGFDQSPLFLNEGLRQVARWNEDAIQARATQLADRAITVWWLPPDNEISAQAQSDNKQKEKYGLEYYAAQASPAIIDLFWMLRQRILNLDGSVREVYFKYGIAFRIPEQFAWIHPAQTQIKIEFSAPPNVIDDPEHLLQIGKLNAKTGRVWNTFILRTSDKLDYALYLVEQSLLLRRDSDDDVEEDEHS